MVAKLVLLPLAVLVALAVPACSDSDLLVSNNERMVGSGDRVVESRVVAGFEQIRLAGEGAVIVTLGGTESLTVETDANLLPYIETSVSGNVLEIGTQSGIDIVPTQSVRYRVGAASLTGLELLGAGSIEVEEWATDDASVLLAGAGEIIVRDLTVARLNAELAGVGAVVLSGSADRQDVLATGVGDYEGADLRSRTAVVRADGVGSATVWATEELDVTVAGIGNVSYYGSPQVTQQVSASGGVTPMGDK